MKAQTSLAFAKLITMIVQAILVLMEDMPASLLLKMLEAVRNLSSEPQSMRQMQAAGAVQKLVSFIKKGASDSHVKLTPTLHLPLLEVPSRTLPSMCSLFSPGAVSDTKLVGGTCPGLLSEVHICEVV
jgi:hypothetical protein